jgi:hypothetical protein
LTGRRQIPEQSVEIAAGPRPQGGVNPLLVFVDFQTPGDEVVTEERDGGVPLLGTDP